jgi:ribonuclease P protein component
MTVLGDQDRTNHHFPSELRLHLPAEFKHVFNQSLAVRDAMFRVLHRPNGQPHCRLGLAVSRKVSRSAVGRNRLKRLVRESFRQHQHQLAQHGQWDFVVLPTAQAATICNAELTTRLAALWKKACAQAMGADQKQNRNTH